MNLRIKIDSNDIQKPRKTGVTLRNLGHLRAISCRSEAGNVGFAIGSLSAALCDMLGWASRCGKSSKAVFPLADGAAFLPVTADENFIDESCIASIKSKANEIHNFALARIMGALGFSRPAKFKALEELIEMRLLRGRALAESCASFEAKWMHATNLSLPSTESLFNLLNYHKGCSAPHYGAPLIVGCVTACNVIKEDTSSALIMSARDSLSYIFIQINDATDMGRLKDASVGSFVMLSGGLGVTKLSRGEGLAKNLRSYRIRRPSAEPSGPGMKPCLVNSNIFSPLSPKGSLKARSQPLIFGSLADAEITILKEEECEECVEAFKKIDSEDASQIDGFTQICN